jgi:hypothetical protein
MHLIYLFGPFQDNIYYPVAWRTGGPPKIVSLSTGGPRSASCSGLAQTDSSPSCSPLLFPYFSPLTVTFPKLAVILRPLYYGRATPQALSHRPLNAEVRVRSQVSPSGICGRQGGKGSSSYLTCSVFRLSVSFHRGYILVYRIGVNNRPLVALDQRHSLISSTKTTWTLKLEPSGM